MACNFHHDDNRETNSLPDLASIHTRNKRACDSTDENNDRTLAPANRIRSAGSPVNETVNVEYRVTTKLSHDAYTVGWVCALHSEMAAAKAMLDDIHEPLPMNPNDTNHYVFGSIDHHNIVIVCLPSGQYGITRAAVVANNMRWSFRSIRIRLMVGIGGGVPSKVDMRLGDVVVSNPTLSSPGVIQYDFGKTVKSGKFQVTGALNKPPQDILGAVAKLRAHHESQNSSVPGILSDMLERNPKMIAYSYRRIEEDRLYMATYDHVGGSCDHCDASKLVRRRPRPDLNPRVHYGTIASANQVMKHGLTRDRLAREYDILCFEMEAAGLMDHFPCLVIRGICDYSDSHKTKEWQEYAAATAAAYTKELLSLIPPVDRMLPSKPSTPSANSTSPMDRRQLLIDSLRFEQIDSRHANIKTAHAQTCCWLLEHPDYLRWLDPNKMADHHGFLWISGKPGTGKSTIMKFAYSHATKNAIPESAVISFFFNARGAFLERAAEGMYRSLLLQLLENLPKLQAVLDDDDGVATVLANNNSSGLSISLIQSLIFKAITKLGRHRVTCFVDALDECDEREVENMLDFFVDLGHCAVQSDAKLYICFSSRHYPYMDIPHCQRFTLEDQTGHEDDIEAYVRNKLRTGNRSQSGETKTRILQKASGVFLWVVLVVAILNKEYKRGRIFAVNERLKEIPPGLSELFRDILTRDKDNMDDFFLCIQWLLFGSRPLKREEYYFAMTAGLRSEEAPDPWDDDKITKEDMNLFVLSSSKGLAETATKSKMSIVQFIHESVRDFLLKDGGLKSLWPNLENDFEEKSHDRLKQCCYTYIKADISGHLAEDNYLLKASSEEVTSLRQEVSQRFPLMEYAATRIFHHANAAASAITQEQFLKEFSAPMFRPWALRRNLFAPKISRLNAKATLLDFFVEQHYISLIKTTVSSQSLLITPMLVDSNAEESVLIKAIKKNTVAAEAILQSLKRHQDLRGSISPSDEYMVKFIDLLLNKPGKKGRTPLSYASEKGLTVVVQLLLELGVGHRTDNEYKTPLLWAIENGHGEIVKLMVSPNSSSSYNGNCLQPRPSLATTLGRPVGDLASPTDRETATLSMSANAKDTSLDVRFSRDIITNAFQSAVSHKRDDIATFLLGKGAETNPTIVSEGFRPSLHTAIEFGLETLVEALLEKGEDIVVYGNSLTALHLACGNATLVQPSSAERIIESLIAKGADINACDKFGKTPLHLSCGNHRWREASAVAKVLIDRGADIRALDGNQDSPLHLACHAGNQATVELLVEKGADIRALNSDGLLPLHSALLSENQTIMEMFLSRGVGIHSPDKHGKSLLHLACQFQNLQTAEMLVKKGAVVGLLDKNGKSPLHYACQGDKPMLSKLRDGRSMSHELQKYGIRTDLEALDRDVPEIVDTLLRNGARLECKDKIGETPLFSAVRWSTGPIFNLLLEKGADIFSTNVWDQTAFFLLPTAGYHSELYLADKGIQLLRKGLDPMHRDDLGQTFLHVACQSSVVDHCYLNFVRKAIQFGLDVDARDNTGRTPLMNAAKFGNWDFVSFLLGLEVDANQMDQDGCTALTEAIRGVGHCSDRFKVIYCLLSNGANPHPSPETKFIALFVAVENADYNIVPLLLNHGVNIGVTDAIGRSCMFFLPKLSMQEDMTVMDFHSSTIIAQFLLKKGADINHRDATGQTHLHYAAKRRADRTFGDPNTFYRALGRHNLDAQDQTGKTPLLCAVSCGNSLVMGQLLKLGANPNIRDNRGQTPLCERIAGRMSDLFPDVRLLIEYGAVVAAVGLNDETPLALAMRLGNAELIELLQSRLHTMSNVFTGS
ncbi:hypothetical protein EsH8_X_000034 [Colletotrichum jinshuiense]